MDGPVITTIPDLQDALQEAVALEFSTIPTYLSGWWTVQNPLTQAAAALVRDILVVEMRHMAIAANTLIATGEAPSVRGAVEKYPFPTYLPDGENEFEVNLLPFGTAFLNQAMKIEQPTQFANLASDVRERYLSGQAPARQHRLLAMGNIYLTIGQFYEAIVNGINTLVGQLGESQVFPNGGNTAKQVGTFRSQNITVSSSKDANTLLTDIVDEGEGASGSMWDETGTQLSHYYTFQEISLGKAYQQGDKPNAPSGPAIPIPTPAQVANMRPTPKMSDYPPDSQAWLDADAFNTQFAAIVTNLDITFSGDPDHIVATIDLMDPLLPFAQKVLTDPVPSISGVVTNTVAGPTFELPPYTP